MVGAGDNEYGQMDDGTTEDAPVPFLVSDGVVDVACGRLHTVFLKPGSDYYDLYCVGSNANGQLGDVDGSTTPFTSVNTTAFNHASGVLSVKAGAYFTLYLSTNNDLFGLGSNAYGQLGESTPTDVPHAYHIVDSVSTTDDKVLSYAAGNFHTLYVTKTGNALYATGYNGAGQLGTGSVTNGTAPTKIKDSGVAQVFAGGVHSLYITTDDALYAMGDNTYGQLGDGSNSTEETAVKVVDSGVTSAACGRFFSYYIDSDKNLYATGDNTFGQLGDGTNTNKNSFVKIASDVVSVSAGRNQGFYITTNGDLYAIGYNNYGQLCDGSTATRTTPVKVAEDVVAVSSGDYHTMYLTSKFDSPYYPNYKMGGKWGYTMGWIDDTFFPWVWDYTVGCWYYVYGGIDANLNKGYWIYYYNSDCSAGNWGYVGRSGGVWCLNADGVTYSWVTSGETLPTYSTK
jgi:alpha-tubulin suppressor-like RCC1 family protein